MRAARYYGRRDIRVEEVDEPALGADDIKLRVLRAGICGSDLHEYYNGPLNTRPTEPHPLTGVTNPVILGHELCGEVVAVGSEIEDILAGQIVAVHPIQSCLRCFRCTSGERARCEVRAIHGLTRDGGGFSEITTIKRSMAHVLPEGMTPEQGALVEPMSIGLTAVMRIGVNAGETAAVHGLGPIGLGSALALRARGVQTIVADPSPLRRDIAAGLGFQNVLDPADVDIADAIADLTGGVGAHGSIDAAGVPAALNAAIASTAFDRHVAMVALPLEPLSLDVEPFRRNQVHLTVSSGHQDYPEALRSMARGDYPLDGWVTTIALEDVVSEGFEPLHRQEKAKVLVDLTTVC